MRTAAHTAVVVVAGLLMSWAVLIVETVRRQDRATAPMWE